MGVAPGRAALLLFALSLALAAHATRALQVVTTLDEVAAIERSAQIHALILVAEKPKDGNAQGEEVDVDPEQFAAMAAAAYPSLPALEEELDGVATFSIVDLSPGKTATFANKWNLPSLPVLVLYKDPPRENPYTGKLYREAFVTDIDILDHPRKLKKLIKESVPSAFVDALPTDSVETLDAYTDKEMQDGNTVVLLVSKQKQPSHLFRALATAFHDRRLAFAFVSAESAETSAIMSSLKLDTLPSMVVFKSKTVRFALNDPDRMKKYADLKHFISPFVKEKREDAASEASRGKSMMDSIVFISGDEFQAEVIDTDVIWIIAFVTPEQESALDKKQWTKTFAELQKKAGIIGLGAVSCERDPAVCEQYGGPGTRVFSLTLNDQSRPKRGEMLPEVFSTLAEAKEAALNSIPDVTVEVGSSIELQAFVSRTMAENTMPVLFFTSKPTTPPMVKSLAMSFPSQKMEVAVLRDADEELKTQFTVRPTETASLLCLVAAVGEVEEVENTEPFGVAKYDKKLSGPYNFPNVMRFMMEVLSQFPHPRDDLEISDIDVDAIGEASSPSSLVPYLTKENLESLCNGNKICAIGFFEEHVDTLADPSSPLTKSWTVLARAAALSKQNGQPFHFMWVNGKCQADFADAFGIGHYQMPTVAVYSPAKQRFATNVGLFEEDNVNAFLKGILSGKIGTAPLNRVPVLKDDCSLEELMESADASVVDAVEDDESLDDLLSEIITEEQKNRELLDEEAEEEAKKSKSGKKKSSKKSKKSKKKKTKKNERDEL